MTTDEAPEAGITVLILHELRTLNGHLRFIAECLAKLAQASTKG